MGWEDAEKVEIGSEGVHQTLFDEQVVSTDTRHTFSTATKPRMPSQLVAAVGKHGHDSSGRVCVGHLPNRVEGATKQSDEAN